MVDFLHAKEKSSNPAKTPSVHAHGHLSFFLHLENSWKTGGVCCSSVNLNTSLLETLEVVCGSCEPSFTVFSGGFAIGVT